MTVTHSIIRVMTLHGVEKRSRRIKPHQSFSLPLSHASDTRCWACAHAGAERTNCVYISRKLLLPLLLPLPLKGAVCSVQTGKVGHLSGEEKRMRRALSVRCVLSFLSARRVQIMALQNLCVTAAQIWTKTDNAFCTEHIYSGPRWHILWRVNGS